MARMFVYAGPNGSGKSTIIKQVPPVGHYVNADEIQKFLGCSPLEAAKNAEATRECLLQHNEDFSFETVLSTDRNLKLMQRAKKQGYSISCVFILTCDPAINVLRVNNRVRLGGHDVPCEKIITRYMRSLSLIPSVIAICDELYIFDNSLERGNGTPSLIYRSVNGESQMIANEVWNAEKLSALIAGTYPKHYFK